MGIVYLVQDSKHIGTNIYKIGMSQFENEERIKSYGKNRRVLCIKKHENYDEVEDALKIEFRREFELFHGEEWFKGDENEMKIMFCMISFLFTTEQYKSYYEYSECSDIPVCNEFPYRPCDKFYEITDTIKKFIERYMTEDNSTDYNRWCYINDKLLEDLKTETDINIRNFLSLDVERNTGRLHEKSLVWIGLHTFISSYIKKVEYNIRNRFIRCIQEIIRTEEIDIDLNYVDKDVQIKTGTKRRRHTNKDNYLESYVNNHTQSVSVVVPIVDKIQTFINDKLEGLCRSSNIMIEQYNIIKNYKRNIIKTSQKYTILIEGIKAIKIQLKYVTEELQMWGDMSKAIEYKYEKTIHKNNDMECTNINENKKQRFFTNTYTSPTKDGNNKTLASLKEEYLKRKALEYGNFEV